MKNKMFASLGSRLTLALCAVFALMSCSNGIAQSTLSELTPSQLYNSTLTRVEDAPITAPAQAPSRTPIMHSESAARSENEPSSRGEGGGGAGAVDKGVRSRSASDRSGVISAHVLAGNDTTTDAGGWEREGRSRRVPRYSSGESTMGRYTREVRIKQGALRGVVLEPSIIENLQNVDMYLGIPYAAPPVGSQRFMPPGSPPPWTGVRTADRFAPVCPQMLPDLGSEPGKALSEGRYNSLKRLLPYLTNQSEDCLYLNIYTPSQGGGGRANAKYPVLVFIHGESYEWNSGNPYDGSVLASYGHVVVITINFRLGILGFLKPGLGKHTVSNFGLWDQIAALQWVKENVGAFGGDPHSVTLMGHGTGAACANLLLVSPVSNGLFHRAILMSGSALADWAITHNPIQSTIQVAEFLNCPSNDELASCLRRKRLSEIMRAKVTISPFKTPFGPVVDGSVVPNEPAQVMGVYNDLFSKYELLYGVTEVESYHLLDAVSLHMGILEKERDHLLRQYVEARFEFLPDVALAKTLSEYKTHWRTTTDSNQQIVELHRDSLLDILSDARVASPVVQTADYHSTANPKSYFYVFTHRTKHGDFAEANVFGSIHGEELAYVFGVPMDSGRFPRSFTDHEKLFSEAIMTYWTNFAKTGNPNAPRRSAFLTLGPRDWRQYDLDWPEYDVTNQTFLTLAIPPHYGQHYRKKLMKFWNEYLPKQLKNPTTTITRVLPPPLLDTESPRMEVSPPWGAPQNPQDNYENFKKPYGWPPVRATQRPRGPTQKPTYGRVKYVEEGPRNTGLMDGPPLGKGEDASTDSTPATAGNSNMALSLVVIVGVCFLVVNVCAFAALFYQRGRLKIEERIMKRRLDESGRVEEGDMNPYAKRVKLLEIKGEKGTKDGEGVYEAVSKRTPSETLKLWRGQGSTSTVDAHTKVRDWIQQEIVNRCSPRFIRRPKLINQKPLGASTETSFSQSTQMVPGSSTQREASCKTPTTSNTLMRKVKKVSVAVDATPAARSASVQKQVPIELSKSLDALTNLNAAQQRPILKRANTTMDDNVIKQETSSSPTLIRRSTTSINLLPFMQKNDESIDDDVLPPIHHGHSHSEPVPFTVPFLADVASDVGPGNSQSMKAQIVGIPVEKDTSSYKKDPPKQLSTFPKQGNKTAAPKKDASVTTAGEDINVTSRDSYDEHKEGSSEDPLTTMQRRNFPKVLPDLPSEDFVDDFYTPKQAAMKRRSLPPPSNLVINLLATVPEATNSQPTTPTTPTGGANKKPPPPPPRVSSTLGRKPSNTTPVVGDVTKRPPVVVMPTTSTTQASNIQRVEPKVIIKPTGNKNQVAPNKTVGHITGARVNAGNDPRQQPTNRTPLQGGAPTGKAAETRAPAAASAGTAPQLRPVATPKVATQPKTPDTNKRKVATKKNCETSTDDDSSSNTGTIKRVHKAEAKKK